MCQFCLCLRVCECVCGGGGDGVYARACLLRVCVCACVRACVRVCVWFSSPNPSSNSYGRVQCHAVRPDHPDANVHRRM